MAGLRVILLGTGTSHGVPMIGCDCPVCTSSDPRDRRTRSSIAVQLIGGVHPARQTGGVHPARRGAAGVSPANPADGTSAAQAGGTPAPHAPAPQAPPAILIDTTPELRIQCLANDVRRVDAVLFTHSHADHVAGLDDLRRFNWLQRAPLTCYGDADTIGMVERMFSYAFDHHNSYVSSKPQLFLSEIKGAFDLLGERIIPIPLFHGPMPVLGFRFRSLAYCTDCSVIPDASMELLNGLDVLVLDALRHKPHPTHFTLAQAVEAARRIGAKQTYFTHIAHELGHASTNASLPPNMALGFDGQIIEL